MSVGMVVLRCTQKLRRRMGKTAGLSEPVPKSSTRLGDWYANALSVSRQHVVLGVSGVTLLPVLVRAAPYQTMLARLAEATGEMLGALGVAQAQIIAEVDAMRELVVASSNDRRVLGSMNDFMRLMEAYIEDHSLPEVALKLAEARCGPLRMKSPREATLALFSTGNPSPGQKLMA